MISKRHGPQLPWLRGWHDGSRFTKGGENMSIYKFVELVGTSPNSWG